MDYKKQRIGKPTAVTILSIKESQASWNEASDSETISVSSTKRKHKLIQRPALENDADVNMEDVEDIDNHKSIQNNDDDDDDEFFDCESDDSSHASPPSQSLLTETPSHIIYHQEEKEDEEYYMDDLVTSFCRLIINNLGKKIDIEMTDVEMTDVEMTEAMDVEMTEANDFGMTDIEMTDVYQWPCHC